MARRVLIEAEKLGRPLVKGTQRYVRGLLGALRELAPEDLELHVLSGGEVRPLSAVDLAAADASGARQGRAPRPAGAGRLAGLDRIPGVGRARRALGRRRIVRRARRRWVESEPFDLVHLTSPHSFRSLAGCGATLVGTVLDLTHARLPETHLRRTIEGTEEGLRYIAARAAAAIAISEATRRDFLRRYRLPPERVRVVPLGVDHDRFHPRRDPEAESRIRRAYGIRGPFLLALSTLEPRKNIEGMVEAWRRAVDAGASGGARLVIAGALGWKTRPILESLRGGGDPDVVVAGYVEEEDLATLYRAALALCYVSHYEGFGLPLLEAMSCGLPVVFGDNSGMREVVGRAGLGLASRDIDGISEAMGRLAGDASLRQELSRRSIQRAARFSWERTARETVDLYRALL